MRLNPQLSALLAVRGAAINQTLRGRDLAAAIRALFSAGQVGAWYDFSDGADLFDDSAGTTAIAAAGHIGLALDNSLGLVLGSELVTNGTFDSDTAGWVASGCTAEIANGRVKLTVTSAVANTLSKTITTLVGRSYKISGILEAPSINSTTSAARIRSLTAANDLFVTAEDVAQYKNKTIVATGTSTTIALSVASSGAWGAIGDVAYFDNISLKELPGNHLIQSTTGSQPLWQTTYAEFDAFDDYMTAAAGGGGTTGFLFAAAIRPSGTGTARTLWSDTGTNTGYKVTLNTSDQLVLSAGNGTAYTSATGPALTDGTDYVVMCWHDGTNLNVSVNNGTAAQQAFATATAGTARFTIGSDNGAVTSPFGARFYGIVYRKNDTSTASERTSIASYLAGKAGVTL